MLIQVWWCFQMSYLSFPVVTCKPFMYLTVIQASSPDLPIPQISFFRDHVQSMQKKCISMTGGDRLIFYFSAADKEAVAGHGG